MGTTLPSRFTTVGTAMAGGSFTFEASIDKAHTGFRAL